MYNSFEHQLFLYTVNDQTVLFKRIQLSISYSFAFSLDVKLFDLGPG